MNPGVTNINLFMHINHFAQRTSWLHGPMQAMANYGIAIFGLLLVAGWLRARRRSALKMAALVWAGLGTAVAVAANQPLVRYFHESRPYMNMPHILVLAHRTTDYGFPSDHATMAGAVTAGLFLVDPLLGGISLIGALILAFSRVYISAHYPFDVLAGLIFGAVTMLITYALLRKPLVHVVEKVAHTALRPLVTTMPASKPTTSKE